MTTEMQTTGTGPPSYLDRARYTFRVIARHPLTRDRKLAALRRWLAWQIGCRLVPGPVAVPFVHPVRLLIGPGMHGLTLNVYVGLDEFEGMGFLLHFLRTGDLFVDVGANAGAYTVLAAGVVGCRAVAFEPAQPAFNALQANVRLNQIDPLVTCRPLAVGRQRTRARFTAGLDTLNYVAAFGVEPGSEAGVTEVDMTTLDDELMGQPPDRGRGQAPTLLKIDVEGYEGEVLSGGEGMLGDPSQQALIVEIGQACRRYGTTPEQTFDRVAGHGFTACRYDPMRRHLSEVGKADWARFRETNTLFVRDLEAARQRVETAQAFRVLGREI